MSVRAAIEPKAGDYYEIVLGNKVISKGTIGAVNSSGEITFTPSADSPGQKTAFTGTINPGYVVTADGLKNGGKLTLPQIEYDGGTLPPVTIWETGIIIVQGNTLAARLQWLSVNAQSNKYYVLEVYEDEALAPHELIYSGKNNISINLISSGPERNISLSGNGFLFWIGTSVTLILDNNVTLKGHSGNNESCLLQTYNGSLVMKKGSKITGNGDAGVAIWEEGTFTMNGGEISNNTKEAGVIIMGTFTMNGGDISNNVGNGITGWGDPIIIMNDGTITGNSSHGVELINGIFTMKGGKITNNLLKGINTWGEPNITMNDGEISNNNGTGVSLEHGGIFSMNGGLISSNGSGGVFVNKEGTFIMTNGKISSNHNDAVKIGGTILMNGGEISNNFDDGIIVCDNGSFIMNNGEISNNSRVGVMPLEATFIMNGGKISGNTGGGLYMCPGSIFTMNNGEILNNTGIWGGGVFVHGSEFIMNGGKISGNTADYGGGVYLQMDFELDSYASFTMNGGIISGNTANIDGGGGIRMCSSTLRIINGIIYGSSAENNIKNISPDGTTFMICCDDNNTSAQHGTFSGNTWVPKGNLETTDDTIHVINGVLQ